MYFSRLFTLSLILTALIPAALWATPEDSTGHVFIYPEESIVSLNDTFFIYVAVDTVKSLKSFFFNIEVDTTVVKIIDAAKEPFYTGPMGAFFFWTDTTHVFSGSQPTYVYELLASLLGFQTGIDGPGRLLKMKCVAVGHGASGVIFRQTQILDRTDLEIALEDSLNGLIIVCPTTYRFGDADFNEIVNISDAVYLINYIFAGGPAPKPIKLTGDADCNAIISISDVVFIINYIFAGGPAPCNPCD